MRFTNTTFQTPDGTGSGNRGSLKIHAITPTLACALLLQQAINWSGLIFPVVGTNTPDAHAAPDKKRPPPRMCPESKVFLAVKGAVPDRSFTKPPWNIPR
jgi:hypothetical protein